MSYIRVQPGGVDLGWVGNDPFGSGNTGAWFKKLWIGGTSTSSATIVADASGNVTVSSKITITSTSGSFSKTVTIDPAGFNNPIEVADNSGAKVIIDATFIKVATTGTSNGYLYSNSLELDDPGAQVVLNGTKVLGIQQTGPGNPSFATLSAAQTWCSNLLTALRAHGLIT